MKRFQASGGDQRAKTLRFSMEMATCPFCNKTFKKRGLKLHQNHCKSKPKHTPTLARDLKFCLLNEQIFQYILGFLGNQTLVKLQGITGDFYNCSSELAQLSCSCENDSPAMVAHLCLQCDKDKNPHFQALVSMAEARDLYGLKKFTGIPRQEDGLHRRLEIWSDRKVFDRADLEQHKLQMHGTKILWLRAIAAQDKKDGQRRKFVASRIQKKAEYDAMLQSLPTKCATYVRGVFLGPSYDAAALKQRAERYSTMAEALDARGLPLRDDSKLCRQYIIHGGGNVAEIVDTMEEMAFLFGHTNYSSKCSAQTRRFRTPYVSRRDYGWDYDLSDSDDFYSDDSEDDDDYYCNMQECRENIKKELCVKYLGDNSGLSIPRKWEACRSRYDHVVSVGASPSQFTEYVYSGKGKAPTPLKTPKTAAATTSPNAPDGQKQIKEVKGLDNLSAPIA